jgi:hypothetical protein
MEDGSNIGAMFGGVFAIVMVGFALLMIVSTWKLFAKAGYPGWAALVPIYNMVVMLKMAGKPVWWIILFMVPFVNFVMLIMTGLALAKAFGKGAGFGLGMIFLGFVFVPMLAFGDSKYMGAPATA